MLTGFNVPLLDDWVFGPEVFVADTNVLLLDACNVLVSGAQSALLRAIELGTAIGVMSDRTFLELGWMSAPAARYHGVEYNALRTMLAEDYLPCFPVVTVPAPDSEHWMPLANEVTDVDDVPHAQLARLVSAWAVYSHDKDLRRPRLAPATRADYDQRVATLSTVSDSRVSEQAAGLGVGMVATSASAGVSWAAARLSIRPEVVWASVGLASALSAWHVFASPARRSALATALTPVLSNLSSSVERANAARRALRDGRLVISPDADRLESRVASYLVRLPDSPMRAITEGLSLNTADRRKLPDMLRSHPVFESTSRYGWSVGRIQPTLTTHPPVSWRPRGAPAQ